MAHDADNEPGMEDLPPELQGFSALLDAQPGPVREAFHYCLCLMMAEAGVMRLVETFPSDAGTICHFETTAGEQVVVTRPPLSREQEGEILVMLREILDEDDAP